MRCKVLFIGATLVPALAAADPVKTSPSSAACAKAPGALGEELDICPLVGGSAVAGQKLAAVKRAAKRWARGHRLACARSLGSIVLAATYRKERRWGGVAQNKDSGHLYVLLSGGRARRVGALHREHHTGTGYLLREGRRVRVITLRHDVGGSGSFAGAGTYLVDARGRVRSKRRLAKKHAAAAMGEGRVTVATRPPGVCFETRPGDGSKVVWRAFAVGPAGFRRVR